MENNNEPQYSTCGHLHNHRSIFQPWYDDRADYNTNAKSYYDYLARHNGDTDKFIPLINRLLARNVLTEDTNCIDLTKTGDWIDNGSGTPLDGNGLPTNYDDIVTLKADVVLSKYIQTLDFQNWKSMITPNGIECRQDGLYSPDYKTTLQAIDQQTTEFKNQIADLQHRTEAVFFPLATKEEAWSGTTNASLITPKTAHDAISVFHQKANGSGKIKFACHRGNTTAFPEGSPLALRYSDRFDMTEFDIQLTSDKEWVVFHDYEISRMTNGTGVVKDLTLQELRSVRIDVGNNIGTLQDFEKVIPKLDEALEYCRLANTRPMIEIKTEDGENKLSYTDEELKGLAKKLNEVNALYNGIVIQSFDLDVLIRMREFAPECICVWNIYHLTDETLEKCKQHFISPNVQYTSTSLSRERVAQYHEYGLIVSCWVAPYTEQDELIRKDVDIIITSSSAGNTRVNDLKPTGGASHTTYTNPDKEKSIQMRGGYTTKISPSTFALNGGLDMGNKKWAKGDKVAELWEEHTPYLSSSVPCFVKYKDGTYETAWLDIVGYVEGNPQKLAGLYIGAGWEDKEVNWIRLSGTYDKY